LEANTVAINKNLYSSTVYKDGFYLLINDTGMKKKEMMKTLCVVLHLIIQTMSCMPKEQYYILIVEEFWLLDEQKKHSSRNIRLYIS